MPPIGTSTTFGEYLVLVATHLHEMNTHSRYYRMGQAYINCLPERFNAVIGTELDCFYDDSIIPQFLAHIESIWSCETSPCSHPNCSCHLGDAYCG